MELEQLEQLCEIRRAGTISAAAEALHISQPALSRSMRRLEADLGQELFVRSRNRARFNEAGELALEHADAILAEVRRMREDFDELSRKQRTLRVASVAPAPNWRFSALALEHDPTTILDPEIGNAHTVERELMNREAHFAITLRPSPLPNVLSRPLMTEDLYLYAPHTSKFAKKKQVYAAELDGETFLVYEQIGFWMDRVRRDLPHAELIVQRDRTVFMQLVASSELLCFTTNVPENAEADARRVAIPLADASAHATFFLNILADASEEVRDIFTWIGEHHE